MTASTACRRTNTVTRGGLGERPRGRHCRAGFGQRKDHRRNGFDGCAASGAGIGSAPFKVGPDFIDPGYHALAAGRPGRNLDPVLVGERLIGPLYRHGSAGADIAVVEGVMGLFDGRIERRTRAAPLAVHRPRRRAAWRPGDPGCRRPRPEPQHCRSAARLFDVRHRRDTRHRRGDPQPGRFARHEQVLRQACEHAGVPVLGAIPRADELSVPSRHLGLVTAVEHGEQARVAVEAMTGLVDRHVDVAGIAAGRPVE